jgi:competence protein ComEA
MKLLYSSLLAIFLAISSLSVFSATVDINTADAATLDTAIAGVGSKTAAAIVAYRTKHGPFKKVDDLTKVKGIGPKLLERNRQNLSVGGGDK